MRSKENQVPIPVGTNCDVAHYLRAAGLRKFALPFDWVVTPVTSALELIDKGCEGLLHRENLVFLPPANRMLFSETTGDLCITNEIITPVVDQKYRMLFPHDFSAAGERDFQGVLDKYRKRVSRLLQLLDACPLLIYVLASPNEWQKTQFQLAGVEFPFEDQHKLENSHQSTGCGHLRLISLEKYKASLGGVKLTGLCSLFQSLRVIRSHVFGSLRGKLQQL